MGLFWRALKMLFGIAWDILWTMLRALRAWVWKNRVGLCYILVPVGLAVFLIYARGGIPAERRAAPIATPVRFFVDTATPTYPPEYITPEAPPPLLGATVILTATQVSEEGNAVLTVSRLMTGNYAVTFGPYKSLCVATDTACKISFSLVIAQADGVITGSFPNDSMPRWGLVNTFPGKAFDKGGAIIITIREMSGKNKKEQIFLLHITGSAPTI